MKQVVMLAAFTILALTSCTKAPTSMTAGSGRLALAQALSISVPQGNYQNAAGIGITVDNAFLAQTCVRSELHVTNSGTASPVSANTAVSLSASFGQFYSDSSCINAINEAVIPAGSSSIAVYFKATSAGIIRPTVSAPSENGGEILASATFATTYLQKLSAAGAHSCAIVSGEVYCWGDNENGRLGRGIVEPLGTDLVQYHFPEKVVNLDHVVNLAAGAYQTCALKDSGEVYCWGQGAFGQIGDGRPMVGYDSESGNPLPDQDTGTPSKVSLPDGKLAQGIASGNHHNCALVEGEVYCWGENNVGQLGTGDLDNRAVPAKVIGVSDATAVFAGFGHSCAIRQNGAVLCWGSNHDGQLGVATSEMCNGQECSTTAIAGPVLASAAVQLTLDTQDPWGNASGTCALLVSGRVSCWGGVSPSPSAPIMVKDSSGQHDLTGIQFLVGGNNYNCAIDTQSSLACWGANAFGVLGFQSATFNEPNAMSVAAVGTIRYASGGALHNCAVNANNAVYCWGFNSYGQLGDGSNNNSMAPIQVKMADGSDFAVP